MGWEGTRRGSGGSCSWCSKDLPDKGDQGSPCPYPRPLPQPPWMTSSHNAGRAMQWPCGCGWTTPRTTSTRGEWGCAGLGGLCWRLVSAGLHGKAGADSGTQLLPTGGSYRIAEARGRTSSGCFLMATAGAQLGWGCLPCPHGGSCVHRPYPCVSVPSLGSTMADVWAHGWDHWGWESWGVLCVPGCLLPTAHFRGLAGPSCPTRAHGLAGAVFGLGTGLVACVCSVCSWHSLTPYHDPSQAMAVAFRTCSRQVASLGHASLPLPGVPGTRSSP